ncbi:MAG: hypothetical protein AB8B65_05325 [Kordia sp.]|uniref:hypothetical protein n=1 Tax=Kordia sp. TaxID=1965332 RepID=UPI00385D2C34
MICIFCTSFCWSQETFEGVITYKIELTFKKEDVPNKAYIAQKFGDTLKIFYNKKGDIHKKYIGSGAQGYDFHTYKTNTNNFYAKWENIDTLYHYNVNENILTFLSKESGTSEAILNKPSKYILIKGYVAETNEMVHQKFYYTGFPYLNPALFKNFKEFFLDEILKTSKSPFLKKTLEMDDFIITYTVIKIERKFLSPKIFKLPKNIPQKKT